MKKLSITRISKINFQTDYFELNVSISGNFLDKMQTNLIVPEEKFILFGFSLYRNSMKEILFCQLKET